MVSRDSEWERAHSVACSRCGEIVPQDATDAAGVGVCCFQFQDDAEEHRDQEQDQAA